MENLSCYTDCSTHHQVFTHKGSLRPPDPLPCLQATAPLSWAAERWVWASEPMKTKLILQTSDVWGQTKWHRSFRVPRPLIHPSTRRTITAVRLNPYPAPEERHKHFNTSLYCPADPTNAPAPHTLASFLM